MTVKTDENTFGVVEIDHRNVSHEGVLIMGRIEAWSQMVALLEQDAQTSFEGVTYQDYAGMMAERAKEIARDLQVRLTRLTIREGSGKLIQLRDLRVD